MGDERVKFYANTFGGTVFVTKDGEIVYVLPKHEEKTKDFHHEGYLIKGNTLFLNNPVGVKY